MRVLVKLPADSPLPATAWWPKGDVTGTITKRYKNGSCAVSVDQLPNRSDDGLKTMTFPASYLVEIEGH